MAMHANIFNVPRPRETVSQASLLALPLNLLSLIIAHVRHRAHGRGQIDLLRLTASQSLTMSPILHDALKCAASCIT